MKKIIAICSIVLISTTCFAQYEEYDVNGSMSVARGCDVYADSSAWVHIGDDTTNKGVIMPNVLLGSINTVKRGLFVYGLEDSVLYHFDGTDPVRYMTYKDTNLIKNLTGIGGAGDIAQGGNAFGLTMQLGTTDNYGISVRTNNTERMTVASTGDVGIINNLNVKGYIGNTYTAGHPFLELKGNESVLIHAANGNNGSIFLGFSGISPDFGVAYSNTAKSGVYIYRGVTPVSGSANLNYVSLNIKDDVDYTNATGTNVYIGLCINPSLTGNVSQRAIQLLGTSGHGMYQTGSAVLNYFNGNTSFGSSSNTAKVDITGANGYDQLRLRTSYTPTSTSDTNGNTGDVTWDDSYIYIKTSAGWKRSALSTF